MQHLVNFCNNRRSLKRDLFEFEMIIQRVFIETLTSTFTYDDHLKIVQSKNIDRRCIMCSKLFDDGITDVYTNANNVAICNYCVKMWINCDINFYFGRRREKCILMCNEKKLFDELISNYMTDHVHINNHKVGMCIMCARKITSGYTICNLCADNCIQRNIGLGFNIYVYDDSDRDIILYPMMTLNDQFSTSSFIKNLPKLFDNFFNVTPIMFINALSDVTSSICVLNDDIIMYILSFIY